ncbi:DUF2975 domain-containing protein [Hymenobacter coalescens]
MLRTLALLQFILSAVGVFLSLSWSTRSLTGSHDLVFVTLERTAPQRGQLAPGQLDLLQAQAAGRQHFLIDKSQQQRLVYREAHVGKRLALALLGYTNSSLGRSSTALLLFSMFTGLLLYRILRDLSLDSPFTSVNAARIRWLGLLMIGLDVYNFLATVCLRALVPAFPLGDGSRDAVRRFAVLDPAGDLGSWKFGLVLLVVAAVYQRGVVLAEEAELTV